LGRATARFFRDILEINVTTISVIQLLFLLPSFFYSMLRTQLYSLAVDGFTELALDPRRSSSMYIVYAQSGFVNICDESKFYSSLATIAMQKTYFAV